MVLFKEVDSVLENRFWQSSLVIGELRTWALGVGSVVWGCITGSHQCIVREGQVLTHCQELQGHECGFSLDFLWFLAFISSSVKMLP